MFDLDRFASECKEVLVDRQLTVFRALITPSTGMVCYDDLKFIDQLVGSHYESAKQILLAQLTKVCLAYGESAFGYSVALQYDSKGHYGYHVVSKQATVA